MNHNRNNFFKNILPFLAFFVPITSTLFAAEKFSEPVDVSFMAECDGTTQHYVVLLPDDFDKEQPYTVMLALHGHGSNRWQYIRSDRGECKSARDVALKYNMIFVSPDYRAKTSWMGPQAEADLLQIIGELKSKFKIDRTILIGGSMGGSSSLSFSAMHPEMIDAVGAMNGTANHLEYENFQEFIQTSFGGTKKEIPDEYKKRSAEYWPERFTMPVGLTTGGKDTTVPPGSCVRLAAVVKKLNPDVLHIHRPAGGHSTTYKDAVTILEFLCSPNTKRVSP